MTTQHPDLSFIIPAKWKPWTAALGSLLTFVLPFLAGTIAGLPPAGQGGIAAFLIALTWLGVYKVPYAPAGTTLAVDPKATRVDTLSVPSGAPIAVPASEVILPINQPLPGISQPSVLPGEYSNPFLP